MFETWEELENSIVNCNKCKLCKTRQNIVFGVGNKNADIMFIGEGPGADEDRLGEPFVGRAGKLMDMAFGILGMLFSVPVCAVLYSLYQEFMKKSNIQG